MSGKGSKRRIENTKRIHENFLKIKFTGVEGFKKKKNKIVKVYR
jgi:hypothetical protein